MSLITERKFDSDLMFRFIGLIMIIIGLLTALYASDTSLSQQIVPVYYFISFVLVFVGIYGLVSIIRD
tara:strand:+ start:100 stop:303 length:204 start_codon:yes stop_codon:yes gene_type:complete